MADKRPPYTSASDLDRLFERIPKLGDPGTIDSKWVDSYQLAGSQPEGIVSALRWLGVIDKDGKSTGRWNDLRAAKTETLTELMETAYDDIFSKVEVAQASREDLVGAFIHAYDAGNPDRLIKCFLALCGHAGIETQAAQRSPGSRSNGKPERTTSPKARKTESKPSGSTNGQRSTTKQTRKDASLDLSVSLNIEIPAAWTEAQITERIAAIQRAIEAA